MIDKTKFESLFEFHKLIDGLNLFQRLVHVQSEIDPIKRNAKGYNYSYARLDEVYEHVLPVLNKYGLFHYSRMNKDNPEVNEVFIVCAKTGELISTEVLMLGLFDEPSDDKEKRKPKMQRVGGLITYSTRYGVLQLLGICPDNDTDASNITSSDSKTSYQSKYTAVQPVKTVKPSDPRPITDIVKSIETMWLEKRDLAMAYDEDKANRIATHMSKGYEGLDKDKIVSIYEWLEKVPGDNLSPPL